MPDSELLKLTISEVAPLIQAREVSPVELTQAALDEAERRQPTLNSFITIMREQALAQAEEAEEALSRGEYLGPLHGIPIGIKDNIATGGITTTLGTKVLRDHVPDEDAEVVRRCKAAGAIIIGKENLEEFAAGATSNNPHYGAVHNPWNVDHIPGGPAAAAGPTWPPASLSPLWEPTWAGRCACPGPSAAWLGSSRPLAGSASAGCWSPASTATTSAR